MFRHVERERMPDGIVFIDFKLSWRDVLRVFLVDAVIVDGIGHFQGVRSRLDDHKCAIDRDVLRRGDGKVAT